MSKPHKNSTVPPERTIVANTRNGTVVFKIPGQVQQQMDELVTRCLEEEERKRRAAELGGSAVAS